MNPHQRNAVRAALASLGLVSVLTACPAPPPPFIDTSFNLTFKFPPLPTSANLSNTYLAAIAFDEDTNAVKVVSSQPLAYNYGPNPTPNAAQPVSAQLRLSGYELGSVAGSSTANSKSNCLKPFAKAQADGIKEVKVTPEAARTCDVYFVIYEDKDGNHSPSSAEEMYMTHDILSYASSPLTFSYSSEDGNSAVSGSLTKGWSLVRHQVLQPTSTPGKYLVSMNSAPTEDQAIPVVMHVPSAFYTSQGLSSAQFGGSQK